MKALHRIFLVLLLLPFHAQGNESMGRVVFYSYDEEGRGQEVVEAEADFAHHVDSVARYLTNQNISHEIARQPSFIIDWINGFQLKVENKLIPVPTGYIMIKANGDYVIRNGIGTDVDMLIDIYDYFGVRL